MEAFQAAQTLISFLVWAQILPPDSTFFIDSNDVPFCCLFANLVECSDLIDASPQIEHTPSVPLGAKLQSQTLMVLYAMDNFHKFLSLRSCSKGLPS